MAFRVRDDSDQPQRMETFQHDQRVNEDLMRQLQQQIAAAIGHGQKLVRLEQLWNSLVEPDVGPRKNSQHDPVLAEHPVELRVSLSYDGRIASSVETAELMGRGDDSGDAVVNEGSA